MKGYYKNWYQHYLELEAEKEKEIQRGYYSNLAPKEETVEKTIPNRLKVKEEKHNLSEIYPLLPVVKKKRKFRLLGLFLPISTILGFIFLWYQMGIGPIRQFVDEAFVWAGFREETIDVMSYHTSLLDQHIAFAEKVAAYINGEEELSFDDLELIYDEIREAHMQVIEISGEEHAEAVRLWSFKISSTNQMMNDLIAQEDVEAAHAQFMVDQAQIAGMIRAELMIGVDY